MNTQRIRGLILLTVLLSSVLHAERLVVPYYSARSQGRNAARNAVGWTNQTYRYDMDFVYASVTITPEYTRSFRHKRINRCLFGDNLIDDDKSTLKISGTRTTNRSDKDLLADYFMLPTDFKSTVQFKPLIDNFLIDFSCYLGLDEWAQGLYCWFHAPLTHTRWDTNIDEQVSKPGLLRHDAGYFIQDNNLLRNRMLKKFEEFVNGKSITDVSNITFQGLRFAKISSKRLKRTRLAEIRAALGWNFWLEKDYHLGFNAQFAAPTGSRPKGRFLFEPMVGNGHHWEAGFGINGHYTFWYSDDETKQASFYADVNITHLFKTRQRRTFDLKKNGTLSRYMMAMKLGTPVENLLSNGQVPSAQFKNEFLPVANISSLNVNVRVGIQADIVAMFNVTADGFSWDVGYNYWGRSCERIKLRKKDAFTEKMFALKGDAHVFGFVPNTTQAVALSATQSRATIHAGRNFPAAGTVAAGAITAAKHNPNIDSPRGATEGQAPAELPAPPPPPRPLIFEPNNNNFDEQIKTSVDPIFITEDDLDIDGARTKGSSSKVFTHFNYTWHDAEEYTPYVGIGGEVEFDHRDSDNCDCSKCSASQWGIWVKGGVTFD